MKYKVTYKRPEYRGGAKMAKSMVVEADNQKQAIRKVRDRVWHGTGFTAKRTT